MARKLALRERPQGRDLHAAGKRLGHAWHREDVGGADEKEAARPSVAVVEGLHLEEQTSGCAGKVLQAAGVAAPSIVRLLAETPETAL